MKKSLLTTLTISSLVLASSAFAADRIVLVEESTSSTCPPCATYNPGIEAAINILGQSKVLLLAYHVWWPSPGNDPMFLANQTEVQDRIAYYGINSAPDLITDGVNSGSLTPASGTFALSNGWDQLSQFAAPVIIDASSSIENGKIYATADVSLENGVTLPNNVQVRVAVVEKHISYTSAPGTNGETDFAGVFRKFIGGSMGYTADLSQGTFTFSDSVTVDPNWNLNEIQVYFWVQDDVTKVVHNASTGSPNSAPSDFSLDSPAFSSSVFDDTPVTFDWSDAIDPDPGDQVTYELSYDDNQAFSSPEVISGLTNSTFTTATPLPLGIKYWKVSASDGFGGVAHGKALGSFLFSNFNVMAATDIDENSNLPEGFVLEQNFPNPFNPSTTISYELPANLRIANLVITNVRGEKVREFELNSTTGSVVWNGTNDLGKSVSSGIYFYKLEAGDFSQTKKMLLLK